MKDLLVVIDMQNDFINGSLGTKEAQAIVQNAVKKIKDFEGEVVYTQDTHYNSYLQSQEGKYLPVQHCIKDTDGWELTLPIKQAVRGRIFEKNTFGSLALAETVRTMHEKQPLRSVTLIGLCTDICVISNALILKAALPEVKITIDSSCCAGITPESHTNALNAMRMCQVCII